MIKSALLFVLLIPMASICEVRAQEPLTPYEELPEFETIGEPASEGDFTAIREVLMKGGDRKSVV